MVTATASEANATSVKPVLKLADLKALDLPTVKLSRPTPAQSVAREIKSDATPNDGTTASSDKDKLQKEIEERLNRVTHKKGEGLYASDIVTTGEDRQVTLHDYEDRDLLEVVSASRKSLVGLHKNHRISDEEFNYLNATIGALEQRRDDIHYLREHKGILAPLRTVLQRAGHRLAGEEWRIFHNANEISIALTYLREIRWMTDYAQRNHKPLNDVAIEFGFLAPGTTIASDQDLKRWAELEKKIYKKITGSDNVDVYLDVADTAFDPTTAGAPTVANPDMRGRNRDIIHNRIVARLDDLLKARGYANYAAVPNEEMKLQLRLEAARLTIYEYLNDATDKIVEASVHGAQGEYSLISAFQEAEKRWRESKLKLTDIEIRDRRQTSDGRKLILDNATKAVEAAQAVQKEILGEGTTAGLLDQEKDTYLKHEELLDIQADLDYPAKIVAAKADLAALELSLGVGDLVAIEGKIKVLAKEISDLKKADPTLKDPQIAIKEGEKSTLEGQGGLLRSAAEKVKKHEEEEGVLIRQVAEARSKHNDIVIKLERHEKKYLGVAEAGVAAGDRDAYDYQGKFDAIIRARITAKVTAQNEYDDAVKAAEGKKTDQERKDDDERADAVAGHALFVLGPKGGKGKTFFATMNKVKDGALLKQENGRFLNGPEEMRNLIWDTDAEVAKLIPTKNRRKLLSDVEYVIVAARHLRMIDDPRVSGILRAAERLLIVEEQLRSLKIETYDPNILGRTFAERQADLEATFKTVSNSYAEDVTNLLPAAVNRIKNEIAYGRSEPEHVGLVRALVDHVTAKCRREQDPFTEVLVSSQEKQAKYS